MADIGAISYATVGVLYSLLTLLLLLVWRRRALGGLVLIACATSAVWGAVLAAEKFLSFDTVTLVFSIEVLRGGTWLTFIAVLAHRIGVSRFMTHAAVALWIGVLLVGLLLLKTGGAQYDIRSFLIPGGLAISLAGLVLIEQLYRNTRPEGRAGMTALVIGLGGLFVYELFLYSQGMLIGAFDPTAWHARGLVNILFVPMIAVIARRKPELDMKIFVSRHVVFYSSTLVAVGLYLVLMSVGGYVLIIYGGTWGGLARIVFFVGAILVLVSLLFSSSLRARFRVFLSKHFFQNKYDYRGEWLRLVALLSEIEASSAGSVAIKALAQIVNSPSGLAWMLDETRCSYDVVETIENRTLLPSIAADSPLIEFVRRDGWLIDLAEYRATPDLYGTLELPDWLERDAEAWLIVPLMMNKELVGLLLLDKATGVKKLNYEDRDLLKTVGNHVAVHLVQERSDDLLAEARQFEAYNRLTAFLMHDLNNLVAQQSLIVKNAEKHRRDPEFVDDAITTIANSVDKMKGVLAQLRRRENGSFAKPTQLRFVVSAAVDRCSGVAPVPELRLNNVDSSISVNADELTMVIVHVIKNAQDATPEDGCVVVALSRNDDNVEVSISDTGTGMSEEFVRRRLFRPFDSTKGSKGMGIGVYQAREYIEKIGGQLTVSSAEGEGTTFTLSFLALD